MAELSGGRVESLRRRAYLVERATDLATIRRWLETRRHYAAYALGQFEPELTDLTEWWTATGDLGRGLVAFARGGLGDALFCMGEAEAVDAILRLHQGSRLTYATYQPEHLTVVRRRYMLQSPTVMSRMAVRGDTFRPSPPPRNGTLRRLYERDVQMLNRLYGTEGGATYYSSSHLREGVYYGMLVDGRLVAAAGTHVVGPTQGIAVVGNVFTHPAHRGRGFAKATTSAVTAALLERCSDVVLTVDPSNTPAVEAYRALGYEHVCEIMEGAAARKDPIGLASFVRRRVAGWRGRKHGGEMVFAS
ncbi:MAG TPA: GNAT family N-acetyltransferase [Dehalococcoidia bacterium]|nr:GNAT family N-acetyltransferase [Dehalococcoidia bacterium]